MTVCGKHGKTKKLFSHPFPSPWKSLRRFPHSHRHDHDDHEFLSIPVKTKTRRNDAQNHYPGGPNQMVKVGHAGRANSRAQLFTAHSDSDDRATCPICPLTYSSPSGLPNLIAKSTGKKEDKRPPNVFWLDSAGLSSRIENSFATLQLLALCSLIHPPTRSVHNVKPLSGHTTNKSSPVH